MKLFLIHGAPGIQQVIGRDKSCRNGLTLVEVLITTVLSILMLMSLAEAFKRIGDSIAENRAALEMSNRLRSVSSLLRRDLEMATAKPNPPMAADSPTGYFKIFEGPMCDYSAKVYLESVNPDNRAGRFGDFDDILMFTASASKDWFTGKVPRYIADRRSVSDYPSAAAALVPTIITSKYAEIIWYTTPVSVDLSNPLNFDANSDGIFDKLQLHRRVLLIRPDLNGSNGSLSLGSVAIPQAYQSCDLSMRRTSTGGVAANSIEDLMYLENRFAHIQVAVASHISMPILDLGDAFAFAQGTASSSFGNVTARSGLLNSTYWLQGDRLGEDVVMSDCLAFDMKVFDPAVPLYAFGTNGGAFRSTDMVFSPNDPGYASAISASPAGAGDFVDLGWYRNVASYTRFSGINGGTPPATGFVGFSGFRNNTTNGFSLSLLKSGMVLPGRWSQIVYDTWTTGYELDSRLQGDVSGTPLPTQGTVWLQSTTTGRPRVDMGTNGIDDPEITVTADGLIDDTLEQETTAPFPFPLRSVKASIRLEDTDTRQLQQISVISEFTTK